jgi:hypothetical protein
MLNAIFGLSVVYDRQVDNDWSESANYGYFAGGEVPFSVNTIDRIDFFNETVSAPDNNLTQARGTLAGVSNSNYGYFAGGFNPSVSPPGVNTIDRIDFFNETVSAPDNNLTQARGFLAAVSNSNYGYFAGGFDPSVSPPRVNTIDRIDFSNETTSNPVDLENLTQARSSLAGVSNSNYGYFGGGEAPPSVNTIDRLDFSSETVSAPGNNLTQARYFLAAVSNSNYGYFAGGFGLTVSPSIVNTIDRIDFSNETISTPGNNLTDERLRLTAVSNSNYGYFAGGLAPPSVNTIDRLDFSNETVSAPGNNLPQARDSLAGVSGGKKINSRGPRRGADKDGKPIGSTYGYVAGGNDPASLAHNTIQRLDFSSETVSLPNNNLSKEKNHFASFSNSNYGYFGAGVDNTSPPPDRTNTIDRLDFSNETTSLPGNNLFKSRYTLNAVNNSNYGYFAGGLSDSPPPATVERLDFFNEVISLPGNNQQSFTSISKSISSSDYGYFFGNAPDRETQKLDFSNEVVSEPGLIVTARRAMTFSNSNYGYIAGGDNPVETNTIQRLDFSNDTVNLPGNNLPRKTDSAGSIFNINYSYIVGGSKQDPTITPSNIIDRFDFSDETVSAEVNNLIEKRNSTEGVSN